MGQLLTQKSACEYLRHSCGSMSVHTFNKEVAAGRIPVKWFGRSKRYRIEDLDAWQQKTIVRSDYTSAAKSGTRIYHSLPRATGMSFAQARAQLIGK